jgi:APA family basic amino acid/polyamine antiporter
VVLGIGCTIGAGIVVLTGVAAHDFAGPGVVLSYAFGGIAAMLTAFCYAGRYTYKDSAMLPRQVQH